MDLLEHQAKELFREMGIPVLPSQRIDHPKDLKGLKIPYPVVLKSQVRAGGRGKAGGVKFVTNTIDAVAAAQTIFNLPIMGEYPEVLLAEAKYNTDRELYLAIVLDRVLRKVVLLGSREGGNRTESAIEAMQRVVVTEEFSPFYARKLALKMGLSGPLVTSVSGIVEKMYSLFVKKDLDLVEINPLAISPGGDVMALDGKVSANDKALGRHRSLGMLANKISCRASADEMAGVPSNLNFVKLDGNIAIVCNGAGLTMAALDVLSLSGAKAACFVDLGGDACWNLTSAELSYRLKMVLPAVAVDKNVKAILVNFIGSETDCYQAVDAICQYVQETAPSKTASKTASKATSKSTSKTASSSRSLPEPPGEATVLKNGRGTRVGDLFPHLIVRLCGGDLTKAKKSLTDLKIPVVDSLEEAIARAISLAG